MLLHLRNRREIIGPLEQVIQFCIPCPILAIDRRRLALCCHLHAITIPDIPDGRLVSAVYLC